MTREHLIDYLKIVLKIEGELLVLKESKAQFDSTVQALGKPASIKQEDGSYDHKYLIHLDGDAKYYALGIITPSWIIGIILWNIQAKSMEVDCFHCSFSQFLGYAIIPYVVLVLASLIIIGLINLSRNHKNRTNKRSSIDSAKANYAAALQLDKKRVENEKRIASHLSDVAIKPTASRIAYLENELKKLYDLDILYPTYRDIIAVAQILEYIESGICTQLEGSNGAYAEYRNDLRTERIVGSIVDLKNAVVSKLDVIARNQHIMCELLKTNNSLLQEITSSLNSIDKRLLTITQQQCVASDYLSKIHKQLTSVSSSYNRSAVELSVIAANQRTQMIKDGVNLYNIKYPA